MSRRKLLLETIEDRILCDAAPQVDPEALEAAKKAAATQTAVKAAGPITAAEAAAQQTTAPHTTAPQVESTTAAAQLTDEQRAAVESMVKESTNTIWFQENVGQFAPDVRYGFKTQFGSMLVYDDHIQILANQFDAETGAVGVHAVDINFDGASPWQVVAGQESGVLGNYQAVDGTTLSPHIYKEVTLRNVYDGIDLRLYSADQGVLEFDWLVAKAQDYSKIKINFTGQDGLIFGADGSASLDLRFQDLTLKMPEVYQVVDGQKQLVGASMVAGDMPGQMRYALSGNIVADQPLVIDPNVAWATYFDLNDTSAANAFDSYIFAIQVNNSGVYCAGWVKEIITNGSYTNYMQVNAGFAQGTVANQNYIYRLNTSGTGITAWTSTGIVGSTDGSGSQNPATDLELFPDGRVLVSYADSTIQIYSASLAARNYSGQPFTIATINSLAIVDNNTFFVGGRMTAANTTLVPAASGLDDTFAGASEGVIIRYTLNGSSVPVNDWATYVGGANAESFTAIAMTPDNTKLVFAVHSIEQGTTLAADAYPALVNPVDSTPDGTAGLTEILTGVLVNQPAKPSAFSVFSLLGGSSNEGLAANSNASVVVVASNSGYWVGGNTASNNLPGATGGAQATFGTGTSDSFVSFIPIGGGTTGFQSTYLGGSGNEITGGIAYDPVRDRVLLFGTTTGNFPVLDTVPSSIYWGNTFGGGTYDIYIATFTGALTQKDYATYIGGTGNDYLGNTGVLLGTGHVTYSSATDQVYLATTVHSTLPTTVLGGATIPGYDKTKSNSTNDVHTIFAFNISIFDHGDAPASYENGNPGADALSLTLRIGATVDAEVSAQSGSTALGDDNFNTGATDDEDGIATLPTLFVDAISYSATVSVFNNTGSAKTLLGWIDFNQNGTFELSEVASVSVPTNAAQQNVTITWSSLPANMNSGPSFLRLRLTENTLTDNGATAIDERSYGVNNVSTGHGEIEDYALPITGATISGTVYQDTNSNGSLTGGEAGIPGVSLTLTGVDHLGNAVNLTTTTDASGNYTFAGLRRSNAAGYKITETQPGGFLDGVETAGTLGGTVSNVLGADDISAISVTSTNTNATGYNFGEVLASSLSGTVYEDNNNNGAINAGENGINNVLITLSGTDAFGQTVNATFTTPAAGTYAFNNLRPGTYTLTETPPAVYLDGKETVGAQASGTINNAADNNAISSIALAQNITGSGNLFGELNPASLSGFVYGDLSNLGVKDAFETGIPGVTITLTGTNDRGVAVNQTVTTDSAGAYSFANLRPGTYAVTETQPTGYTDGADTLGTGLTAPNSAGSAAVSDTFTAITIASVAAGNNTGVNYNFGESPNFGVTKSLQATSVTGTSGNNLAIGEVATFRLVITVPAGTFNDFQVQDALPNGFQFLNNSTAVVAFVSNPSGAITSTTLSGAGLQQTAVGTPTFLLPDTAVSTSSTANNDTYTSGTDVFFKLGNVTNTDTTGATTESIVIEFQAVVVNEAANQAATSLPNTFSVLFNKDSVAGPEPHGGNSNTITSTVVEPVLTVAKALGTSGLDAGDAVQYTITITNPAGNNAAAYDVRITDLLNANIALNNTTLGSGIVVSAGPTVTTNSSTTGNLDIVLDTIAAGGSVTITLNGTVTSTAVAGSTVTNGTTITWTSTPGVNANERNGSGTPALNDYTASANSGNFILARPTVDKLTPSDTTYSVGEAITYDIVVTLPEGVTNGLKVTDNLPAGLDYVSVAVQTAAGGALANAFGGTVTGAPTVTPAGNSYTFDFGSVTTTGDNNTGNNSFVVRVTARVANTIGNQNAVVLTNTGTLTYTDGTNGVTTVNDPTPNVNITVVEPVLTLDKATVGTVTGLDAGDTVQYSITITNTGTATAHEVTLSDALPAGLLVTAINSTTPSGTATIDTATGGVGTASLTGEYTIPAGESITILYTATLQSTVTPNTNYLNTATVTFSSVNGTLLGQGTATGERVGTSPNLQGDGSLNDYRLQDTAQVSTGGVLNISKGVNNSTPSIGDVVTYTVTITLNEGTTQNIVVTDTLPVSGDLQFVAGSAAVAFGTGGSSISGSAVPAISGAGNNVLTFTLGNAVVPSGAGANTLVLTYQVLVRNVATNQAGDVEGNSVHVTATNLTTPPDSTTTITLREPNVTFTKTPDKTTNVDAGDVITYTITLTNPGGANASTAFDALLTDTMPAGLLVTGITSTTFAGGATPDSAAAITGGGTGLSGQYDIPVGATVTIVYTATVQQSFPTNGSLTNGAVLTWTSVNGGNSNTPDANERFGASGSTFGDGSLNDYRRTTSATTTGAAPTFSKVLFSTSDATTLTNNVTIGEQVTYALVVTLPEGTTSGFNVSDALPAGLRYVSSSIVTTAAASNTLLTADFNGTVPAPTVSGGAADGDDVTFAFGSNITTTGDNVANNNKFLILVTAVVTDVPANVGLSLPNSATFSGPGIPPTTPPPVNVTVVEPRLQVTKGVDDPTADLGQTLTFTLTIQHTVSSTATAYDLIIRDAMPSGLTLNTGSVSITGGTIGTNTSTASQLALTIDQLNVGGVITITYTATVGTGAALGGTNQDNNARLYWDTTPADTGTNVVLNGGTDGDDDHDYGATPAYTEAPTPTPDDPAQDTVRVTVNTNSLSGFVYLDSDSSGTRNGAETGVGVGVSVTISGTTFFGAAFTQTVTADPTTGAYTFTNVPRSNASGYTITEVQPGAYVDALETVGTLFGGTKSDALNSDTITNVVVPVGNQSATGYNFGEVQGSSLSGSTYLDLNNDGIKQGGENGLGTGIPVTLTGTDVFGQPVSLSGTSDPTTGAYSFPGLRPSDASGYTITENDAAVVSGTYFDGKDTAGLLNGTPAGTVTGTSPKFDAINVTVGQNQTGTNYNFAEINKSSFSGNVYADLNGNGTFDAFEKGIPGVTIQLTGTDDQGTPVSLTVTTDASGAYTFANIRPSNGAGYTITETQPADYLDGTDTIGTPGGTTNNDSFTAVILGAGVNGANNNFGEAPNFALTKTLVSTSEAGTTGNNVAIGEVSTFRLVVTIPAGQLTDFQVQDFLPAGYAYVNGSARAGLVGGVTSSTINAPLAGLGSTPTFVLPDAAVSNNSTANIDTYASGTDVFFKFGTLTNTDTTAATEAVVIEFNAVVVNEAANIAGTTLTNSFGVLYERNPLTPGPEPDPNPPGTPPNVNTTVVTPVLTFAKTATPTGGLSAGDPVTYTLTITNPGGANSSTAFDALVNDTMPADIRITSITSTVLAGGATTDSATTITGGGTGLSGQYDIPAGGSVVITYVGTVQVTATPGANEVNNAELTWTSINGGNSLTPDSGERYGATGTLFGDGNLNNLRRVDSKTVTIGTASFDKQLFGTSDPATTGSSVAIGENVTYALIVTLPAGTAPSLSVIDSLPAGLQYVSSSIVTSAVSSNTLLAADFNGTVPAPTVSGGAADGDDVTFNFGSITANADGVTNNNTFLILVTARVTDVAGNSGLTPPGQTTLPNTATFDIPGDGAPPSTPPAVNVQVVEARLTINKSFDVASADAGDTAQVTIVVNNTGTGPAHDVLLTDPITLAKFGTITAITTPAGFAFDSTAGTVSYTGGTIAAGGSATFVFSVKLTNGVNPSEVLSNTGTVTATSQPGTVTGERTFGPVSSTATLPVPAVFNLTKGVTSPAGGKVQIGDVITYSVNVTVVEGTTQNISLTDILPVGMSYVANSAVVSNANGMTVNGFAAGAVGQTLTITSTSVVNPGNVDSTSTDSDTFTITYQAVVNDVAGNTAGQILTNTLTGGGTGVPPSTPPGVSVTVTEPQLRVTKAVNDSSADLGQTLHFTLTIQNLNVPNGGDAFDILVKDALPAGLSGLANVVVTGANVDADNSTGTALDLKLDQLALGATVTVEFDATVGTAQGLTGTNIDNNARIYWDSQPAESPNGALTGTPDGDSDRDYGATTGYIEGVTPSPDDPAQDTERVTVNANTVSGFVYLDSDSGGTRNGAETGLGVGVSVTISGTTFFGEAFTQTVTADPTTGAYTFTNVPRSNASGYTITEVQPGAYVDALETVGTLFGGTKSDALNSDTITNVVVPVGNQSATGYNFGELQGSSLSGSTYLDLNNDGIKQGGENGLGTGIPVTLTGTDVFGQPVSLSGTSDPTTGAYSFPGLRPSNASGYTITENDAAVVSGTYFDGKDTAGSLNGTPAGTVTGTSPKFDAINVTVGQNQTGTDYNFAEINKSSFSGNVYADLNGNGTFDAFEKGIPGVTIQLTGTDDQGTPVSLTVTTDASGAYTFANIRPSNGVGYTITETQPADYLDGTDTIGTPGGTTNNDSFTAVILGAGVNGANNNFGEAPNFALTKTLVSTSEAGTTGNNVAIGEVSTFRLVVTIPAGQLTDFQVQDFLPAGYAYVNGSARAGLVGGVTSSTINAPLAGLGSTPTFVLPDAAVSNSSTANTDTYASGTDVFFKFGTLTNTDTTAATEAVVIEFNAVVTNEAANIAGTTLTNSFGVLYERNPLTPGPEPDPNPPGTPPNVNTSVVAPVLSFAKTAAPIGAVSAGDVITYTLTFTNSGTSTAFDALVRDVMPADIRITGITGTTFTGGATADNVAAITGGGTGLSGQYDVPVGGSVTITYTGTVEVSAAPGSQQINNAELTWTSINGGNSLTPDPGERFGAPGTLYGDGNLNNYRRVDSQTVTIGTASFDKQLFGTSDPATAGSNVAIGELVTYALIVTGPAGTAPSLSVIDSLPAGLQFVSSSIVTTAAASNGFLTQDFNGTVPNPTVAGGAADGDDVTFNFGAITVAADGNSQNNTFLILVTARVTDVPANSGLTPPGQTALNNTAQFDIPGDGVPPTTPPPVRVDVVEANLTIDKSFNVPTADAGDTVLVSVVIGNTGTGPAHDVLLTDIVDLTKFGSITEVTTPAGFAFNNASGTVTYTGGSIAAGGGATFTFSVKLGDGVNPSEILSNTATATATSQPGIVAGERTFGPVSDTATLPVPTVFNLTKGVTSPSGGKVQIGDVVTYQVTVRIIEGTTQNISLTDILPVGMTYVPNSAVVSNANGMTVNGFNASSVGQTLTLTATSVTNPGDVDNTATTDSDIFTITYQAVVNDVAGNTSGKLLTNNLTGGGTGVPPSTPPPVTVTVTEPQLRITKAASPGTANLGQTVHFTLSVQNLNVPNGGDAFDILVRDALPAGLSGITGVSVSGANLDTDNSTGTLLDLKLDQIALGATATVEFDAVVSTSSAFAGQTIDNNARIYWDSQPAESPNSALTGTPDGDDDHDYGATTGYTEGVTPTPDDPAQDTERLTITSTTLNGTVYHDANASGSFDAGDTGLAGQTVTLTGTTIFGEAITLQQTTGLGGVYSFANLAPGTYTLTETQPLGYLDAAETAGTFGGTVDNALGSNTIASFTIPAGNNVGTDYNFGEVLASSLSGYVYSDANNDGIRQGGEATIDGVSVQITGTDFLGQSVSFTTTTAGGGAYTVANLRPGAYTITETQPGVFFDGKETVGTQLSGTIDNTQDNNTISAIALPQGVDGADNIFGELAPASLSGFVFDDRNNDGNVDPGEAGIGGVTITLTGTDDRGTQVTRTVQTQPDGSYSFPGLRPGTYSITETQPLAFLDGKDVSGSPLGSTAVNDTIGGIVLSAGIDGTNHRFGELTAASLSGVVFSDLDNDGSQDVGELGIGGVTVTLTGTDDLGNPVNATLQTQPDGTYNFGNLRPGTYTITETQPGAYLDGKDNAGILGGSTALNDVISGIPLSAAQSGTGNTFAELPATSLSGFVFVDADNDGVFDAGEAGQIGVTITLTGTDDLGNPVSLTTQTLADGSYSLGGLRPSDAAGYTVTETQPVGLFDGKNAVGSAGGVTVNNPPSDVISSVVLGANVNATAYNFGELRASSLSGSVFDDRNNDGAQGPGENGIGGVSITLTGTDDLGNPVSTTIQTQPDGTYNFPGLRPGTYSISETTPNGFLDGKDTIGTPGGTTVNDLFSNIVLNEGTDGTANNFAELTPATLSGNVYNDLNNDGTRQVGEPGVGGATITLTGTDDLGAPMNVTVQTLADGTYSFPGLRPGSYTVTETQPAGYFDGKDAIGSLNGTLDADSVSAITVNPADAGTGYNFGELRASSLSGAVFDDRNNDGVQGPGENGIGGVTITLTGTDDLGNPVSTTIQTQPDGSYSFPSLRPGTYSISETTPNGFLDGKDTIGTPGGTTANDVFGNIVLAEGTDGTANNFAELTPATLSGNVYNDLNNDGTRQVGEPGVGGATITLTGTDDLGAPVNVTVQTLADGSYSFPGLRPGSYTVTETQPAGYFDGKDAVGSLNGTLGADSVSAITVNPADAGTGYNFGELRASSLSGSVFDDRNNDGVQGPGENGIGGVSITLTGTDDLGNPVSTTIQTQPDGTYSFPGLRPGTYSISETTPNGFLDGKDTIGTPGGTSANDLFSNIVLAEGTNGTANNFAELTPSTLSGNIFIDSDNDGVRDAGETGLGGETVTLTGTDDLGNPVSATVQTQPDGTYSFPDLRPGTYSISETQPQGYLDGKDTAGSLGGTVGADSVSAIVVTPANTGTNYNFGELRAGTISGTVFRDDSNDGVQQGGEPPLGGVTITLTGTDDLGNPVNTTVQTQPDGSYSFPGLRPGTYTISETTPNGYLDGKDALGTAGGTLGNDVLSNVVLAENQTASGYTFGEILASSVSGHVYSDLNNNGVVDPGETGISGVTISLTGTNDLGQPVALNVQTDQNGDYTFPNLRPGTYRVNEAQPNGYLDGKNTVGTGAGGTTINNPPSDLISNLVVNSNTPAANYNFGEVAPATISGNVFEDMEDDGLRGPGDGSIPGTRLVLTGTDDLGNVVSLQVNTNAAGDFVFNNLRPGTYTLTEVQPDGYVDGKDTTGTAGGTKANDRFSDITLNGGQTGNGYLFAERRPAPVPTTPDLYVFKTDNLTSARPGTRLTYVITGGNAGDATASGVIITDTLPPGVKFISASNGGKLVGGKVVWNIGDVTVGGTFRVTVTVVVEQQIGGVNLLNTVTVKDRFGSPNDPTPKNNRATDSTFVPAFAFDSFNNFSRDRLDLPVAPPPGQDIDTWRPDPLTLVPVYSGEADPGATLSIELFNANGDRIGEQVAVVDAGGNWFVSFPSSNMRDYPASVRIVELRAPYSDAGVAGRNLRNFFVPAIHAGHFSFGGTDSTVLDPRVTAPLLGELDRGNPFALGESVKYNVELLPNTGAPSGR